MLELGCSDKEYRNRVSKVQTVMKEKGLDCFIFWNATSVFYLSGFAYIPTERPMCLILGGDGKRAMFVPRLEVEHAQESPQVDDVIHYMEYPTEKHPMSVLAEKLGEMGYSKAKIGADADGYGSPQGYRGLRLSEVLPGASIFVMGDLRRFRAIQSQRRCVDPGERPLGKPRPRALAGVLAAGQDRERDIHEGFS